MGLRTSGVSTSASRSRRIPGAQLTKSDFQSGRTTPYTSKASLFDYPNDPTAPFEQSISFNEDPNDVINVEGEIPRTPSRIPGLSTPEIAVEQPKPVANVDVSTADAVKELRKANERIEQANKAGLGLAVLRTGTELINAQYKYVSTVNQNQANIMQAYQTIGEVESAGATAQLKEQTKGQVRGGQARLSAVARGQDAYGDIANTAASNEEVYAAQNRLNIQLNTMRQAFGLETQVRQLELDSQLAERERNMQMASALGQGAISILGLM